MTTTTPVLPADRIFDLAARAALLDAYCTIQAIMIDRGIDLVPSDAPGRGEAIVLVEPVTRTLAAWSNVAELHVDVTPGVATDDGAPAPIARWEVSYGGGEYGGDYVEVGAETETAVDADGEVRGVVWLMRFAYMLVEAARE
ncbi:hypothetical protein ACFT5B_02805 [Luteimicrobium sp. NPDC057192]|uniref:hypothetical protein n=1 Tax=Luteimicrobium sp. NPDC057192 TaxID=3346042 RepID=UPI00363A09F8